MKWASQSPAGGITKAGARFLFVGGVCGWLALSQVYNYQTNQIKEIKEMQNKKWHRLGIRVSGT